jgi:serine protease Do
LRLRHKTIGRSRAWARIGGARSVARRRKPDHILIRFVGISTMHVSRFRLCSSTALVAALALLAPAALAPAFAAPPAIPAPASAGSLPAGPHAGPDSFADLAARLLPAVVNVSSSSHVEARASGGPGGLPEVPLFPPGSPFEQFFKDFMDRNRPHGGGQAPGQQGQNQPQAPAPERRTQSLGSGFIIDPAGLVVTNNHVIEGADEITVTLQDNTVLKATVVGRDETGDIALLKVTPEKPLPAVAFGDSDTARVGDWVLAIGNPFGLGGTVTAGIVSARGRDIRQGPYDDFIQTDAAINRGNSGGPLFNMNGEVIGINTAIYSPSGGSIGIGFSIPSNMAKAVAMQLHDFGHPRRGWLGVRIQQVTPDIAESLGLHDPSGAMVAGVNDGGPAANANIRNGDIILKFNNQDVKEMRNLPRIVADSEVGQKVPVLLWRDGKEVTVQATLAEKPDDQTQVASATPDAKPEAPKPTEIAGLGIKLAPIAQDTKDKFQLSPDQKGVVITDVTPDSPAAERGLKPGDVIVEVQQEPVGSPADVQSRVDGVRKQSRKSVLMLIQSQDGLRWVPLSLGGDKDKQPG